MLKFSSAGALTEYRYTVADDVVIVQRDSATASSEATYFLFKDHLGSVFTTLASTGAVVSQQVFSAFGQTRSIHNSSAMSLGLMMAPTEQGFTGHRQMDALGIVHMKGRIYDPTIGRFLQADPFIQAPKNSQNYNRYSYVLNNPMSYTDPSGYFFKSVFNFVKKYWRQIVSIAISVYFPGVGGFLEGLGVTSAIAQGAVTGFFAGGVATGSLRGAVIGAFTGAIFKSIADSSWDLSQQAVASGVVGGVMSDLQGGNFGHGFWSAGIGTAVGSDFSHDATTNVVVSALVGGTISELTGGKFANGAASSAFAAALTVKVNSARTKKTSTNENVYEDKDANNVNRTNIILDDGQGRRVSLMIADELSLLIDLLQSDSSTLAKSILEGFDVGVKSIFVDADYRMLDAGIFLNGKITLNPNSFSGLGSYAQLILGHELIHFRDSISGSAVWEQMSNQTEINAYQWEINNAGKFISDQKILELYIRSARTQCANYGGCE